MCVAGVCEWASSVLGGPGREVCGGVGEGGGAPVTGRDAC